MQITDQLKRKIYKDYWEDKKSPKTISKECNVPVTEIYKVLKENPYEVLKVDPTFENESNNLKNTLRNEVEPIVKKLEKENQDLRNKIEVYKTMLQEFKDSITFLKSELDRCSLTENLENREKHRRRIH